MSNLLVPVLVALLVAMLLGRSFTAWAREPVRWWPPVPLAIVADLVLARIPVTRVPWLVENGHWLWLGTLVMIGAVLSRNAASRAGWQRSPWAVALLGATLNLIVIVANGGYMPVETQAFESTGAASEVADRPRYRRDVPVTAETRLPFLSDVLRARPSGSAPRRGQPGRRRPGHRPQRLAAWQRADQPSARPRRSRTRLRLSRAIHHRAPVMLMILWNCRAGSLAACQRGMAELNLTLRATCQAAAYTRTRVRRFARRKLFLACFAQPCAARGGHGWAWACPRYRGRRQRQDLDACLPRRLPDRAGGASPNASCFLTFSRRAAREMLSRADRLVGQGRAHRVWGGTFHAVANRWLRLFGRPLGLAPDFTVLDQADSADLMDLVRSDLQLGRGPRERRFPKKDTLAAIYSRMVNAGTGLSTILESAYPWCTDDVDDIRRLFADFTQRKRALNLLDYDDLLLFWRAVAESSVGRQAAREFEHILVDEYQDTNPLQAEILLALRRDTRNLMVVGDDAQAIYSFRSAQRAQHPRFSRCISPAPTHHARTELSLDEADPRGLERGHRAGA